MVARKFAEFETNKYWYRNETRRAQKLYIALCIYISAALDFAVSLDLKDSNKLNWSNTASYYSIVHSVRLIIFLIVSDFHRRHEDIIKLFKEPNENIHKCDWMDKNFEVQVVANKDIFNLNQISNYYNDTLQLSHSQALFNAISKVLHYAKTLREDSNYQEILIANECSHRVVSPSFNKLSDSISTASKMCFKIATSCFKQYILYTPNLDNRESERQNFKYLTLFYLDGRLYPSIHARIGKSKILNQVQDCTKILETLLAEEYQFEYAQSLEDKLKKLDELEELVSMDRFGKKKTLMEKFTEEINSASQDIDSAFNEINYFL